VTVAGEDVFPGLARIFRLTRERQETKSGKRTVEVTHGIASLTKRQAGPRRLLWLTRRHWQIEKQVALCEECNISRGCFPGTRRNDRPGNGGGAKCGDPA